VPEPAPAEKIRSCVVVTAVGVVAASAVVGPTATISGAVSSLLLRWWVKRWRKPAKRAGGVVLVPKHQETPRWMENPPCCWENPRCQRAAQICQRVAQSCQRATQICQRVAKICRRVAYRLAGPGQQAARSLWWNRFEALRRQVLWQCPRMRETPLADRTLRGPPRPDTGPNYFLIDGKKTLFRNAYTGSNVERLYCKRPILWLASSKILTPPPAFGAGGGHTGWMERGVGGGSIFWKTQDTALYSTYILHKYFVGSNKQKTQNFFPYDSCVPATYLHCSRQLEQLILGMKTGIFTSPVPLLLT
jgi:hypothetical protein